MDAKTFKVKIDIDKKELEKMTGVEEVRTEILDDLSAKIAIRLDTPTSIDDFLWFVGDEYTIKSTEVNANHRNNEVWLIFYNISPKTNGCKTD